VTYQESAPPSGGVLTCVWSRTVTGGGEEQRIVPDACVDLIWNGAQLWVAGPDTHAHVAVSSPGTIVGARFLPGAASRALGVPADLLRDGRVDLADIWSAARVRRLTERLADAPGVVAAQQVMAGELSVEDDPDPVVRAVLTGGAVPAIADAAGLSERQLHRRCLTAFGYGPKTVHKVLRFQQALRLARKGIPLAEVAATVGYSDQPHLARDVRSLAGVPMSGLL
jgi:AraC-like DNA-binding protein